MPKTFFWIFFLHVAAIQQGCAQNECMEVKNQAFSDGERVSYNIYYSVAGLYLQAGVVDFHCKREDFNHAPAYHIISTGRTEPFYDKFYKVRDRYETFIDTGSLLSYQFNRNVLEGDTKKYENIKFNRQVNTAITDSGVYKVPACIQDVLGAMYFIRNLSVDNLQPGSKIYFNLFLDNQVFKSYVRYIGKETITTRYGKFHAIKIKPLLLKGTMFDSGEKMTVWVTDDANHVPVRIQASIRIGSVKADLMTFDHLRWPLSSLIKR